MRKRFPFLVQEHSWWRLLQHRGSPSIWLLQDTRLLQGLTFLAARVASAALRSPDTQQLGAPLVLRHCPRAVLGSASNSRTWNNFLQAFSPVALGQVLRLDISSWMVPLVLQPQISILTGLRSYLIVRYISRTISDAEHLLICFFAIRMSSLQECIFRSSAHFLIMLLFFFSF